jgi:hypothetical protein
MPSLKIDTLTELILAAILFISFAIAVSCLTYKVIHRVWLNPTPRRKSKPPNCLPVRQQLRMVVSKKRASQIFDPWAPPRVRLRERTKTQNLVSSLRKGDSHRLGKSGRERTTARVPTKGSTVDGRGTLTRRPGSQSVSPTHKSGYKSRKTP